MAELASNVSVRDIVRKPDKGVSCDPWSLSLQQFHEAVSQQNYTGQEIRQPLDGGKFFMDSLDLPLGMNASETMKHSTREILEAFQNLLYLIREDAGDAYRVGVYVDQAEKVLQNVHAGECCCFYRD